MLTAARLLTRSCSNITCDITRKQQFSTILKNVSSDGDSYDTPFQFHLSNIFSFYLFSTMLILIDYIIRISLL